MTVSPRWRGAWATCVSPLRNMAAGWTARRARCPPGVSGDGGVRQSTPYTHVAIVESVKELGGGLYELTTIEGNLNPTALPELSRDANPKQPYRTCPSPTDEITQERSVHPSKGRLVCDGLLRDG